MQYFSKIKSIRETIKGTDLIIHIPDVMIEQKILKEKSFDAEIRINDSRTITSEQRKKLYATIKDISLYTGDDPEYLKEFLKFDYCGESREQYFSLSTCSIDTAREFINFIIDFILKHNIPLSDEALNRTDDIDRYLWGCIKYKRCCLCGKDGETHHWDAIGMGNDRSTYDDSDNRKIQLCREHHSMAHNIGRDSFGVKYHVYGVIYEGD